MIYKSNERELLYYIQNVDILNTYGIFKVQDSSNIAFVLLTDDGRYPKVYKVTNFDDNKLVIEICKILERYYVLPDKYIYEDSKIKEEIYNKKATNFSLIYVVIFSIIFLIAIFLSAFFLKNLKITIGFTSMYIIYLFDTVLEVFKWYKD